MIGLAGQPWRRLAVPGGMSGNLGKVPVFSSESEPIRPACGQCSVPVTARDGAANAPLGYCFPRVRGTRVWESDPMALSCAVRQVVRMHGVGTKELELAVDVDGR